MRVRVTHHYAGAGGIWDSYVGEEGTLLDDHPIQPGWEEYILVQLDIDDKPGLFLPEEIEEI